MCPDHHSADFSGEIVWRIFVWREIFRQKNFSADDFSVEKLFDQIFVRPKMFRPKKFSAETIFGRKKFRPKKFSAENFAVRIAEGGSNGGGPGGAGAPPGPSDFQSAKDDRVHPYHASCFVRQLKERQATNVQRNKQQNFFETKQETVFANETRIFFLIFTLSQTTI